jgi:hypothetical protein
MAATPADSSSSFSPFVPVPNDLQCAHVNTCIVRILQAVGAPCTTRDDQHISHNNFGRRWLRVLLSYEKR